MKMPTYQDMFLKDAIGFVEATAYEQYALWFINKEATEYPLEWSDNRSGIMVHIGDFNYEPIYLSLVSAIIKGQKIIFWHPTSPIVNYNMIYAWIVKNAPNTARVDQVVNKTDAGNFQNIFRK